ncbi:MAG TPA: hypothetical protein VG454_06210 [Gemmatimonadales bacterium]|nr:hypothetical protein [Gemmatimonadales bacterium]
MTREEVLAWLDARRPAPPATLVERLHRAVDSRLPAADSRLPDYLAQVGRALLERVAGTPNGGRELALDLLAADAFATYAFEAQAEQGKGAVDET